MRKQTLFQKIFPKQIPPKIKQDIDKAVDILLKKEPRILEIRLFGSYSKGNFTEKSDIDLGVFVNSPEYSYELYNPDPGDECQGENKYSSKAICDLQDSVIHTFKAPPGWSVHVFIDSDWPYFDWMYRGRKNFIQEVLRGTLLYHHSLPREKTRL